MIINGIQISIQMSVDGKHVVNLIPLNVRIADDGVARIVDSGQYRIID
jgi:hypothetical protein